MLSCSVVSNPLRPHGLACQAPLSMEFFRLEYWSGLPFPSPGSLLDPGIEPMFLALQVDSLPTEPLGSQCPYRKEKCLCFLFLFSPHGLENLTVQTEDQALVLGNERMES